MIPAPPNLRARAALGALRVLGGFLALAAFAMLVNACGWGSSRQEDGVVTLRMATWASDSGFDLEREIISAFEKANPDIRIELIYTPYDTYAEKLLTLTVSGSPPDVFWTQLENLPFLASRGAVMDITERVEQDPDIDTSLYFPNALGICSYEGQIYALPRDVACHFFVYNKDLFDRAGLPYPTPEWTWDDFLAIGKRMKELPSTDGRTRVFALPYYPIEVIFQNGAQLVSEDHRTAYFSDERVWGAIKWWADAMNVHGIIPRAQELGGLGGDLFVSQRAAMALAGPWMIGHYRKTCDFEWDIINMPCGPAGNKARLLGLPIAISPQTKHPEEAWRLLKFLCYSEEAQTLQAELGIAMPARADIAESDVFIGQPVMPPGIVHYMETMKHDTVVEIAPTYHSHVKRAYEAMMDAVNLRYMEAEEAGQHYQRIVEREIAKAERRGLI
jgi:multiple sugar transport system substrate-binding protein